MPVAFQEKIGDGYYGFNLPEKLTKQNAETVEKIVRDALDMFRRLGSSDSRTSQASAANGTNQQTLGRNDR
jgi:hypothetical protein